MTHCLAFSETSNGRLLIDCSAKIASSTIVQAKVKRRGRYQIWEDGYNAKDVVSETFLLQKMKYIHNNPCQPHWGLKSPENLSGQVLAFMPMHHVLFQLPQSVTLRCYGTMHGGYIILYDSLLLVLDWQIQRNTVSKVVKCLDMSIQAERGDVQLLPTGSRWIDKSSGIWRKL